VIVFILKILKSLPNEFAAVAFLAGGEGAVFESWTNIKQRKDLGFPSGDSEDQ
jgi:hypothetical protein